MWGPAVHVLLQSRDGGHLGEVGLDLGEAVQKALTHDVNHVLNNVKGGHVNKGELGSRTIGECQLEMC